VKSLIEPFEFAVLLGLLERDLDVRDGRLDALHDRGMLGEMDSHVRCDRRNPRGRLGFGEASARACPVDLGGDLGRHPCIVGPERCDVCEVLALPLQHGLGALQIAGDAGLAGA
jgi:hypothetical protein